MAAVDHMEVEDGCYPGEHSPDTTWRRADGPHAPLAFSLKTRKLLYQTECAAFDFLEVAWSGQTCCSGHRHCYAADRNVVLVTEC